MAAVLLDDAIDGGKSQSGSLPSLLGSEERFEDAGARGFIHSDSVIADGQHHVRARTHAGMLVRKRHDLAPGGLQVAPFVMPILCRIGVERQRAGELRGIHRTREVLEVVVGHHLVLLVPLAVGGILLEMIVHVPIRNVASGVGPDASVEREQHRQVVLERMLEQRGQ